jgi:tetratricopeptide (TPR) repeat protein
VRSAFAPAAAVGFAVFALSGAARADEAAVAGLESKVADVRVQLGVLRDLVERGEATPVDHARQLYGEGETRFLLEDYDGAAAKLMKAVEIPEYRGDRTYPQAVYYLGESLFKIESFAEAKRYFRLAVQVTDPANRSYQDSLVRLIRLSDLTGDVQGVDQYYTAARKLGILRPELTYIYGKWTANRADLTERERDLRAATAFADIQPGQPFYPQSLYFRAALLVELGYVDNAVPLFSALTLLKAQKNEPKLPVLRDLGHLALGRIYADRKKYKEAIEEYHGLPTNSPYFITALYERAQTYLKMGDYASAARTGDTLVMLGRDSADAPESQLFQGNLLLKIGEADPESFEKANTAFKNLIQTYQPVRDQIRSIVERPNPVAYFDDLLRRDPDADFTLQLPKAAQGAVDANAQVGVARGIQQQLSGTRHTADDSDVLAKKMLDTLAHGGLGSFPQLSEANSRAVELSTRLLQIENDVLHEQVRLLGENIPPAVKDRLTRMEAERAELDKLFLQIPVNEQGYSERLARFQKVVSDLELKLFEVRRQLDTVAAMLTGLDKYWHDTLDQSKSTPSEKQERENDFRQWHQLVDQLDERRQQIEKQIATERVAVAQEASGGKEEDDLRARYRAQFNDMKDVIAQLLSGVPPESRPLLQRLDAVRTDIENDQGQIASVREAVHTKVLDRMETTRRAILTEKVKLEDESRQIGTLTGSSGQLIGQIAVDAFKQVERRFYDVVLRGDVGLVDVAWSRKEQRSHTIEKYAKEKEDAGRVLEDRFKEVLGDAD